MRKKILAALLAVCMLASMMFIPASAAGFDDVADDHWAKGAIDRWSDFGVLNGVGEGSFSPDRGMKRSEFAKFIVELMGLPTDDSEVPFDDVMGTNDEWAAPYITAANKAGIINGVGGNRFSPSRDVKFNEGAAMMARAVGLVESSAFGDTVTDKLTELGMLDENVKADMTFDRAGVAGLANNMIGAYVTADNLSETQEGEDGNVITGTVKGVIVVKGGDEGVAVTIKDVNVPAVVAVGGSVELAGATVETVKVTGTNAVVAADKDTTIGTVAIEGDKADVALDGTVKNVTVEGTDASLTVDGEVENVTVAADATVAKIEGSGVSSENVTNNSAEEIKVNEETVAPTPAEPENPDEGDDEQGGNPGFVPDPVVPPTSTADGTVTGSNATDNRDVTENIGASTGGTLVGDHKEDCDGTSWSETATVTKRPTCTETGTAEYTCATEGCTAKKTVEVSATGHAYENERYITVEGGHKLACDYCGAAKEGDATAHTLTGWKEYNGQHSGTCSDCKAVVTAAHERGSYDTTNSSFHWSVCSVCSLKYGQAVHSFDWDNATSTDNEDGTYTLTATCVCGATSTKVSSTAPGGDDGDDGDDGGSEGHQCAADTSKWVQGTNGHYHNCTTANCAVQAAKEEAQKLDYAAHSYVYSTDTPSATGNCVCGKTETCTHENTVSEGTCSKCHMTGLGS